MDFRKEITEKHCQPIHTKDPYAIQADRKDNRQNFRRNNGQWKGVGGKRGEEFRHC